MLYKGWDTFCKKIIVLDCFHHISSSYVLYLYIGQKKSKCKWWWWLLHSDKFCIKINNCKPTDKSLPLLNKDVCIQNSSFFFSYLPQTWRCPHALLIHNIREAACNQRNLLWIAKPVNKIWVVKLNELWAVILSTTIPELPLSGALSPQQLQGSYSEATVGDCQCTASLPGTCVCVQLGMWRKRNAENSPHF